MKKTLLIALTLVFGFSVMAQKAVVKPNLQSQKAIFIEKTAFEPAQATVVGQDIKANKPSVLKATDAVTIVSIGTSANAYGFGYAGGQKSLVNTNNDLNMVSNVHRQGGALDPGGYSGDLSYDYSIDGGMTWSNQNEIYTATNNSGGTYYTDAIRYPHHGVYNPAGNTDPTQAYMTFFGPNLDGTNSADSWGGYSYGRAKVGDNLDTTKHLVSSRPADGVFQYIPDGFAVTSTGDFWVGDLNQDWSSGALVWLNSMIISHGTWNETTMDWDFDQFLMDCETQAAASRPALQKVEFSPDGQIGYIAVLSDNGSVDISKDISYYPIIWRTEDAGATWSDPIAVAIAGEDGIGGVQNYLSDEEIAEIFAEPLPDRTEIPFTTAFDFDLSVDMYGNPQIAVMCGVTGTAYDILTGISPSSKYAFTCAFLLSSSDLGNEGSWIGYELGRPVSFRGNFGDLTEDNRIQIARTPAGDKMFVSWLDTDTTVSAENNAPDIWARGVNLVTHELTGNDDGDPLPNNVTFGSEGTFSAYFFAMGNEVFDDGNGNYTIPYVYENMNPADPAVQVDFKYVQDFMYTTADFIFPGIEENAISNTKFAEVSQSAPNPASTVARFDVTLTAPATVSVTVTNMMGQTVKVLPARTFQAGTNNVAINVADLTSGVYFYTVEAGNDAITKKMIVK